MRFRLQDFFKLPKMIFINLFGKKRSMVSAIIATITILAVTLEYFGGEVDKAIFWLLLYIATRYDAAEWQSRKKT